MPRKSGCHSGRRGRIATGNIKLIAVIAGAVALIGAFAAFSVLLLPKLLSSDSKSAPSTAGSTSTATPDQDKSSIENSSVRKEHAYAAAQEFRDGRGAIDELLRNNPDRIKLMLVNDEISDDDLSGLADCTECKILDLTNNNISGPGLKYLKKLQNLTTLVLSQNDIQNRDLKFLVALTNLKQLDLSFNRHISGETFSDFGEKNKLDDLRLEGTEMTDDGLKALSSFGSIVSLNLVDMPISENGVKNICLVKNLADLDLSKTNLTKAGLEYICKHRPTLRSIMFRNTNIVDSSIPDILRLRKLQVLDLSGTKMTNAGILKLAELPELKQMWCGECHVDEAIAKLRKSKPKLHVYEGLRIHSHPVPRDGPPHRL